MYKCLDCGNTDKFTGIVTEKGNAYIYQNPNDSIISGNSSLSWAYIISDKRWKGSPRIKKCFFCKSSRIKKVKS